MDYWRDFVSVTLKLLLIKAMEPVQYTVSPVKVLPYTDDH
jgi:hypothetical protein